MTANSFGSRAALQVAGERYEIYRLDAAEGSASLPFSLKILLENLLRNEDGANITASQISALASWDPAKEPDKASKARLPEVEREIANLKEQVSGLRAQWQKEREVIETLKKLKAEVEAAKGEAERAQRSGDFESASKLRYGRIPELEKRITVAEAELGRVQENGRSFLREEVT